MAFIVQKYGGSSLAEKSGREKIVNRIGASLRQGDKLVVVVSAMGRKGAPYATDSLLGLLLDAAPDSSSKGFEAEALARDMIASCGELISASVMATMLGARGIRAVPLSAYSAGIRASGPYGDATISDIDHVRIMSFLEAGSLPVITGFQAVSPNGNLLTIGRGGSDTSAVAIGAYCNADYVDIFTDVPGVAMADPKLAPFAPYLKRLDYASMYRLASNGARVLHDRSAILAERFGVNIRIRSSFDDGEGTLISAEALDSSFPALLGITAKTENELAIISIVAREGMGSILMDKTRILSEKLSLSKIAEQDLMTDPDVLCYSCPKNETQKNVQELLAALL